MASAVSGVRLTARLASRHVPRCVARRGFRASTKDSAAQNFTMPALSPTMTEGNISGWRVKEGDSFVAGDVLLEIETDKATMDVEAQDDGVMFKILQPDGSKGVKVGSRIGVTAETGDDLSSLEVPAESEAETTSKPARKDRPTPQEEGTRATDSAENSASAAKHASSLESKADLPATEIADVPSTAQKSATARGSRARKQTYPLYPSVEYLLHTNGLGKEDVDKIPTSGPNGRLLKGDVLAYLGRINKEYPTNSSDRIEKLTHLDLSNIQLAKPVSKAEAPSGPATSAEPALPAETEIAVPISLSAVIATQKRVQDSLGIFLPLSTFVVRASQLANEDLPPETGRKPTAHDLFNAVLGLDQVSKPSRGNFTPQVTGLTPSPLTHAGRSAKTPDIIDVLAPRKAASRSKPLRMGAIGVTQGDNIFSVTAKLGDEQRATEYLERMKIALEKEPGRLVL